MLSPQTELFPHQAPYLFVKKFVKTFYCFSNPKYSFSVHATPVCVSLAEIAGVEIWPRPEQDSGLRVIQERALAPHLPRGTGEDPQPHQHRVRAPRGPVAAGNRPAEGAHSAFFAQRWLTFQKYIFVASSLSAFGQKG